MKAHRIIGGAALFLVLIAGLIWHVPPDVYTFWSSGNDKIAKGIGDVNTLLAKYDRWKMAVDQGDDKNLVLELRYTQGMSSEFTQAYGDASFDLVDGTSAIHVYGLPEGQTHDVWLVDNRPIPGHSVKPEQGDGMINLGTLRAVEEATTLQASLDQGLPEGFKIDLVVVTPKGENPIDSGLLFGSPNLFQRIYFSEQANQSAETVRVAGQQVGNEHWPVPFRALIPAPAFAAGIGTGPVSLKQLIDEGEDVFLNEEFEGNGRTCATCHPPENNFTIDPAFIAGLPQDDPLFVAENEPALADLENPTLMRYSGLILENTDGFGNDGMLRGTPHTLGLSASITPDAVVGAQKVHALGWSGGGAANFGSLREFAIGAVTQHFPKTMARVEGSDFRPPTSDELTAMEAFQLALGRPADPDLTTLELTDTIARFGQKIFLCTENAQPLICPDLEFGTVTSGRCNVCHENGGANLNFTGINANFDTGVERMDGQPGRLLDPSIPCDAGFGDSPAVDDTTSGSPCEGIASGFGDGTFNTPPVIEAADTAPFFHNHAVKTLEGAIAFYNGGAFNNSPGALAIGINGFQNAIGLDEPEVDAVSAFLRVLNSLENIRNAINMEQNAIDALRDDRRANVQRLLKVCLEETTDALHVLKGADLHFDAVAELEKAESSLSKAIKTRNRGKKIRQLQRAMARQRSARSDMCSSGDLLCEEI